VKPGSFLDVMMRAKNATSGLPFSDVEVRLELSVYLHVRLELVTVCVATRANATSVYLHARLELVTACGATCILVQDSKPPPSPLFLSCFVLFFLSCFFLFFLSCFALRIGPSISCSTPATDAQAFFPCGSCSCGLSVCPSVCLSACLSVCLSVWTRVACASALQAGFSVGGRVGAREGH
jgi:hypothetical protein